MELDPLGGRERHAVTTPRRTFGQEWPQGGVREIPPAGDPRAASRRPRQAGCITARAPEHFHGGERVSGYSPIQLMRIIIRTFLGEKTWGHFRSGLWVRFRGAMLTR